MFGSISEDLNQLQNGINKLMGYLGLPGGSQMNLEEDVIVPMVDVKETDEAVIVIMDLPGVDRNDVDISIFDNTLRVAAERNSEKESTKRCFYTQERTYNRFERAIDLPVAIRADEARAKLENGILEITLPKEIVTTRKRVTIA